MALVTGPIPPTSFSLRRLARKVEDGREKNGVSKVSKFFLFFPMTLRPDSQKYSSVTQPCCHFARISFTFVFWEYHNVWHKPSSRRCVVAIVALTLCIHNVWVSSMAWWHCFHISLVTQYILLVWIVAAWITAVCARWWIGSDVEESVRSLFQGVVCNEGLETTKLSTITKWNDIRSPCPDWKLRSRSHDTGVDLKVFC